MGKKVLKTLLAVGVLLVLAIIASVWLVWKRPLAVDARFSRLALGRMGFETSWVATPDGRLELWQAGSGPTLVLLHGAGDQAGAWARMVKPLLAEHRVLIPDLPGHGPSDPRSGPIGVGQVLAGVRAVVDTVPAGEQVVLVGNSLGAWVAMLYAVEHPERVERLVAINGGAIREDDPRVNLFPASREEARATMKALMGPGTPPLPDFVLDDVIRHARVGPAGRLAQTAGEMGAFLLDDRLHEVTVPVELVWGDADGLMRLDYAQRLLDGLPRARLTTVPRCGHVPHRECPDATREALRAVLALPPPEVGEAAAAAEPSPAEVGP